MKFKAKSTRWDKVEADVLAMFVTEEAWEKETALFNKALSGALHTYLKSDEFTAKEGQFCRFPTIGKIASQSVMVVGVGKRLELNLRTIRKLVAELTKRVKSAKFPKLAIDLTSDVFGQEKTDLLAQVVVEGAILGSYTFSKYKSETRDKPKEIGEVWLLTQPARLQYMANGIDHGVLYSEATCFARDLINESPSITTPMYLAQAAQKLGKKDEVAVEILDEKEIRKLGMNAYLAVARGSAEAPKFIKLTYKGGGKKKVVLAGKAITFDTGGLSLKDAKNMETMKLDMAGAAAVLGIFKALPLLKPSVEVVGLIAACENMPGPRASKPGDVVTALNGKSIEILNTDAEGRLTLADVLSYAVREKPDYIVDLATLTGACMVALGEEIAGLFSNYRELSQKLMRAGEESGEKLWELPLEKDYKETIKSHIADLRNTATTRYGGAITAALFLEEFVDKLPWAHLDIAGPAFEEKDTAVVPKGGAGFGVRTLLNFLKNL